MQLRGNSVRSCPIPAVRNTRRDRLNWLESSRSGRRLERIPARQIGFLRRIRSDIGAIRVSATTGSASAASALALGSTKRSIASPARAIISTQSLKVRWNRGVRNGSSLLRVAGGAWSREVHREPLHARGCPEAVLRDSRQYDSPFKSTRSSCRSQVSNAGARSTVRVANRNHPRVGAHDGFRFGALPALNPAENDKIRPHGSRITPSSEEGGSKLRGSPSRAGICPRRDREGGVQATAQEGPTRHALTLYESSAAAAATF
jgi:hypothetical protein